ncbi:hypothetical protein [Roseateles amylovorans]|uniref:Uncharacterized protein n=1 Tax=Roseateles amylovorans TaxID=2978473 RepID=A0ABY6B1B6_9BURK|nr:hypothetical protein [Roseateles amylovorans]UXH78835.1 hypothetical protein N4261_02525 [Roseateles amylovorans]
MIEIWKRLVQRWRSDAGGKSPPAQGAPFRLDELSDEALASVLKDAAADSSCIADLKTDLMQFYKNHHATPKRWAVRDGEKSYLVFFPAPLRTKSSSLTYAFYFEGRMYRFRTLDLYRPDVYLAESSMSSAALNRVRGHLRTAFMAHGKFGMPAERGFDCQFIKRPVGDGRFGVNR